MSVKKQAYMPLQLGPDEADDHQKGEGVGKTQHLRRAHGSGFSNEDAPGSKKSYIGVCICFATYVLAISIAIPAVPALILGVTNYDSAASSYYNGWASLLKHLLEFFCSPVLGTVSDLRGRKYVLVISFSVCAAHYMLLALFPSVFVLCLVSVLSGMGDAGVSTCFTIITDIARHNGDNVTQKYAYLSAMFGLAFIVGPLLGGVLADISVRLCLLVAAGITVCGTLAASLWLEETLPNQPSDTSRGNSQQGQSSGADDNRPELYFVRYVDNDESFSVSEALPFVKDCIASAISGIKAHLSHERMRELTLPYAITTLGSSVYFIFYLFLQHKFNLSATDIGIYLSFNGVVVVLVQGLLIRFIIPRLWSESTAAKAGVLLSMLHFFANGFSTEMYQFYVASVVFCLGSLYMPALKAIVIQESIGIGGVERHQGNLQGVLGSINTFASGVGALLFSSLFSIGVRAKPSITFLPFAVSGFCFLVAAGLLFRVLGITAESNQSSSKKSCETNNSPNCRSSHQ